MAFDEQALNHLYDWWQGNGNQNIVICLEYDGRLVFYDTKRSKRVASMMRPDDGPCFMDYAVNGYLFTDYLFTSDPFTDQEHQELEKFMRVNDAKLNN